MSTPDVVALLVTYLTGVMPPGTRVATRVPSQRPPKFVQLRLVSWSKVPPVRRRARVDVFSWGADVTDETGAMALGRQAMGHINALIGTTLLGGVTVYEVEETLGLRQSDDPETGIPRGWATYSIVHRDDSVPR